jgi:hypothetical protein
VVSVRLLVASILTVAVQAQRSGVTFQGMTGLGAHSGCVGPPSPSSGFFSQRSLGNGFSFPNRALQTVSLVITLTTTTPGETAFLFPYFLPDYDPVWYEPPDTEEAGRACASAVEQHNHGQSFMREKPAAQVPSHRDSGRSF